MTLWLAPQPLILASRSASRRAVLSAAQIPHEALPADIDERAAEQNAESAQPDAVARHLAQAKARAIAAQHPGRIVLGADQTLALGTKRFSKPRDRTAAADQLAQLSGRAHQLHSGLAVIRDGNTLWSSVETATLTMRALSPAFIESYLDAAGEAVSASVGGYQLEALGIHLFERIEGDHFTILGLPMIPLLQFFRAQGWLQS